MATLPGQVDGKGEVEAPAEGCGEGGANAEATPWRIRGPCIVAAACPGQPDVLFCMSCGANAQHQRQGRGKLLEECLGPEAPGLAEARRRLRLGLHPHPRQKNVRLGQARGPSAAARASWRTVLDPLVAGGAAASYGLTWDPMDQATVAVLHGFPDPPAAIAWERRKAQEDEEEARRRDEETSHGS